MKGNVVKGNVWKSNVVKGSAVSTVNSSRVNSSRIDRIIRSRRKSFTIQIDEEGRVIVRAPNNATDTYILELVSKKHSWIEKKQKLVTERQRCMPYRNFSDGDRYPYLGKYYPLRLQSGQSKGLQLQLQAEYLILHPSSPLVVKNRKCRQVTI